MNVTLASIVHTAWALVLSQYVGAQDVVFATTIAGRDVPIPGVNRIDGPTLTVVPRRCVFDPQQSLKQRLAKMFEEALLVGRHSQYGLRRILSSASQSPELFDTMVNIIPYDEISNARFGIFKPHSPTPAWKSGFALLELLVKMDHGLYDGTLLRIIGAHFATLERGEVPSSISNFRDYVGHLANIMPQKRDAALAYFTERLPKVNPFPNIEDPAVASSVWVPGAIPGLEDLARHTGVTVPILFQAGFPIWLSRVTGTSNATYNYLYTGRNVDIPGLDPQEINGCTANFLPVRSLLEGSISEYLKRTQAEFWEMTEHGIVGLNDIFQAANLDRNIYGNRTLFLFQPFESSSNQSASKGKKEEMKWVVMQGSEVTMVQPYGLVFEVHKTQTTDKFRIKVTYDERY